MKLGLRVLTVAVGAACIVAGARLLAWAAMILDNIWTYNDAGTLTYVILATLPGVPGLCLLLGGIVAVLRPSVALNPRSRRRPRR